MMPGIGIAAGGRGKIRPLAQRRSAIPDADDRDPDFRHPILLACAPLNQDATGQRRTTRETVQPSRLDRARIWPSGLIWRLAAVSGRFGGRRRRSRGSPRESRRAAGEESGDRRFLGAHARRCSRRGIAASASARLFKQRAVEIAVENCRVDIAAAADRRSVAEMLCHLFDGADHRLFCAWPRCRIGSNSCNATAARLVAAQVRKSLAVISSPLISRRYSLTSAELTVWRLAVLVDVLEQLVSRQVAAILDDAREPAVVDVGLVVLAALAAKTRDGCGCPRSSTCRSRNVVRP